jgi:hypothetical protein
MRTHGLSQASQHTGVILGEVEAESARLYRLLQDAGDREIKHVGFMPDATIYGMNNG